MSLVPSLVLPKLQAGSPPMLGCWWTSAAATALVAVAVAWFVLSPKKESKPPKESKRAASVLEDRWTVWTDGEKVERLGAPAKTGIRVCTWNVLADAYAFGQNHCDRSTLRFERRLERALSILERLDADVLFLQEVDQLEAWTAGLAKLGYECVSCERSGGAPDACVTAFRREWTCCECRRVHYDDLVPATDRLGGRYRRHNVGLVVRFDTFVAANTHLHWDPARTDVKLAQMRAFLKAVEAVARGRPVIAGGDFNSTPAGPAVKLAVAGCARIQAHHGSALLGRAPPTPRDADTPLECEEERWSRNIRIVVDFNLNRLCRWLRLVGVDVVLETTRQAEDRCARRSFAIVQVAREQQRLLVTCSRAFAARRDVLELPHVFVPSSMSCEDAFTAVARASRLRVAPADALTRCVLCNGIIKQLDDRDAAQARSRDHKIPPDPAIELFACTGCAQTFWWSENEHSSAARAKDLADRLAKLADDALRPDPSAEQTTRKVHAGDALVCDLVGGVTNSLQLRSAFPLVGSSKQGPITNYVPGFQAQIDYLFYTPHHWRIAARRRLPTKGDLKRAFRNIFFPCRAWPSDHIAVVADFVLRDDNEDDDPDL